MAAVRVGVRFGPAGGGRGPARDAARLRGRVEAGVRAEEAGLDVAWVGEQPVGPDALVAAALPLLAALAARTARIRLATAVLPIAAHHPLRLAEDAATLDGLCGGRLELGLGLGDDPAARAGLGGPGALARSAALDARVAGLREAFGAPGADPDAARVVPPPVQAGGPPLWLGVRSVAGCRRAGRLGMGLLLEAGGRDEDGLAGALGAYREAWRRAGRAAAEARAALVLPAAADGPRLAARAQAEGVGHVDLVAEAGGHPDAAIRAAARWARGLADAGAAARARGQPPAGGGR